MLRPLLLCYVVLLIRDFQQNKNAESFWKSGKCNEIQSQQLIRFDKIYPHEKHASFIQYEFEKKNTLNQG